MLSLKPQNLKFDKTLLFLVFGLTLFGILIIFDASSVMAMENFGDRFHFARLQLYWAVLGILILFLTMNLEYNFWRKFSFPIFLAGLFSLILVLVPHIGIKALGGRRWISFKEFTFQPAELAKISSLIYFSSFLEKKKSFFHFIFLMAILSFLLMAEPDLGTTVVLVLSSFIIYFLAGASFSEIFVFGLLGLVGGIIFILISPYRLSRVKVFLNPNLDPQGASYHLRQALLALGSGGLLGRGIGQSRQKFLFLPEAATDSIFAIIGEEMGFIGGLGILSAFLFFLFRGLKIANQAKDRFGQILAGGITSQIFIQAFLNLSSMVSLLPLTGVPLPFISYGGSSLIVSLAEIGILLNISKHKLKKE